MLECVDCGTENDGSTTLCQGCGRRLLLAISALDGPGSNDAPVCVRCGCPGRRDARFCAICGTPCLSVLALVPALDTMAGAVDIEIEPFGSATAPSGYPGAESASAPLEPIVAPVIAPPPFAAPMSPIARVPVPVPIPAPLEVAAELSLAAPQGFATRPSPFFRASPSIVTPVALVVLVALYVGTAVSWLPLWRSPASEAVAALPAAPTGTALAATRSKIELLNSVSTAPLVFPAPPATSAPDAAPSPPAEAPLAPPRAEPLPSAPTVAPELAPTPAVAPVPRAAAKAANSPAAARAAAAQRAKARRERLESRTVAHNAALRQQAEAQRHQAAEEAAAAQAESQRHAMLMLPAAVPVAAPVGVKTTPVREACAGRGNFIARGLCEWRACRHAEHAGEPVCVSLRQAEVRQQSWRDR